MLVAFDIETGPLPDDQLAKFMPQRGEFDSDEVKIGNLKNPEKIQEKIEEAMQQWIKKGQDAENEFMEKAPLSPLTGKVIAIGVGYLPSPLDPDLPIDEQFTFQMKSAVTGESEASLLEWWWQDIVHKSAVMKNHELVGHGIYNFDLPMLVWRSWANGVKVPESIFTQSGKWINWNPLFKDTGIIWQLGLGPGGCKWSLHHVGSVLGTGGKIEGDHGALFHELIKKDPEAAYRYLRNDVLQPLLFIRCMKPNYFIEGKK